jgi:hypothetical protein
VPVSVRVPKWRVQVWLVCRSAELRSSVLGLGLVWVSDLIREVGVGDGVMLKVVVRLWEGGFWGLACAEEWRIGNST